MHIKNNPLWIVAIILGYFIIGTIYSIIKWRMFVYDTLRLNKKHKLEWIKTKIPQIIKDFKTILNDNINPELQKDIELLESEEWNEYKQKLWLDEEKNWQKYDSWRAKYYYIIKPEPEHYKEKIIGWIVFWVPSAIWTLLNDPIRHLSKQIYYSIYNLLKSISDNAWKGE